MIEHEKAELRRVLRARRDALAVRDRQEKSAAIAEQLVAHPLLAQARRVALYAPVGSEVETGELFTRLRPHLEIFFPRVDRLAERLSFAPVNDLQELQVGAFSIHEPTGPAVPLKHLDLVVAPGLGFDLYGSRLGYGGGYYDRTLSHFSGRIVGLAFACQLVQRLPREAHDVTLAAVVSEEAVHVMQAQEQTRWT